MNTEKNIKEKLFIALEEALEITSSDTSEFCKSGICYRGKGHKGLCVLVVPCLTKQKANEK